MSARGRPRPPHGTGALLVMWGLAVLGAPFALAGSPAAASTEALQRLHAECSGMAATSLAEDFGLEGCIAYQRQQLAPPDVTRLAVARQLAREWRDEKLARVDRLVNPQGDTELARYIDLLGTTVCLAADVPPSLRDLKDLLGSALGTMFSEAGAPDPCSRYQSGPFSRALGQ